MSAKVKNQHYIPQMYLNLFSTNDNRLCVWNLSTDQVLKLSITLDTLTARILKLSSDSQS